MKEGFERLVKEGFYRRARLKFLGGGDGMNKRASVTIESLGLDYSTALNYRPSKESVQEAEIGKRWNAGKTVPEIAKALHLSPDVVTNILDGLKAHSPDLVRGEHEAPMTAKKQDRDDDCPGPEWNAPLKDLYFLCNPFGGYSDG